MATWSRTPGPDSPRRAWPWPRAALIVMPGLAMAKRRTGRVLGNPTLIADSAETAFCAFTAAATLAGVSLNTWLGWWWADPAAALVIAALAAREGLEAWEHENTGSRGVSLTGGAGRRFAAPTSRARSWLRIPPVISGWAVAQASAAAWLVKKLM